jgi:peptidyl-prolyl cis-trans isomerase SurA
MNYKQILKILIFSFLLLNNVNAIENKILFKVDNKIITSLDILSETEYLGLLNKDLKSFDNNKVYEISKNSLIREKIKEIELSKRVKEIKIEEKYLEMLVENFYKRLALNSKEELINLINNRNIKLEDIKKKITIEMLWNQLIINKYSKNIKINEKLIKEKIIANNKKKNLQKEYLLSEIVFNIKNNENLNKKFEEIKKEINENSFNSAALVYSISQTSSKGGDLGWIKETSLSAKIKKQIKNININNITNPIVIPGGFIIIKVVNIREKVKILDIEKEVLLVIKEKKSEQLNQFSNMYFSTIKKDIEINEL